MPKDLTNYGCQMATRAVGNSFEREPMKKDGAGLESYCRSFSNTAVIACQPVVLWSATGTNVKITFDTA